MVDLVGKNLGKYNIIRRLGSGGMAEVYLAFQPGLEREVAIKVILSHLASNETFIRRFKREAEAVAGLRHPNILQVHDFDTIDGISFMVMEYIDGPTLLEELEKRQFKRTPYTLTEISQIFSALANAIDYAHTQRMIHRDLKPANIMFTGTGQVVLTDFGLARIMESTLHQASGGIAGTPSYMSPEQTKVGLVDHRSDIYSLGVILFEMATGRLPFLADSSVGIMMKHVTDPPPIPSTLNPKLTQAIDSIILRALNKAPDDRYQSAGHMAQDLRNTVGSSYMQSGIPDPVVGGHLSSSHALPNVGRNMPSQTMPDEPDFRQSPVKYPSRAGSSQFGRSGSSGPYSSHADQGSFSRKRLGTSPFPGPGENRPNRATTSHAPSESLRPSVYPKLPNPAGGYPVEATYPSPWKRRIVANRQIIAISIPVLASVFLVGWLILSRATTTAPIPSTVVASSTINTVTSIPTTIGTSVPTASSGYLQPGPREVQKCFTHNLTATEHLVFCVVRVTVETDRKLSFDVSWTGLYESETFQIEKTSDADNKNIFLTDNLGNRYDHIGTNGAAAQTIVLIHSQAALGEFMFPAPKSGATTFTFHDNDFGESIADINLAR